MQMRIGVHHGLGVLNQIRFKITREGNATRLVREDGTVDDLESRRIAVKFEIPVEEAEKWNPTDGRIDHEEFIPRTAMERYFWNGNKGVTESRMVQPRQSWLSLVTAAKDCSVRNWPRLLRQDPGVALAFCLVYPHRLNPDIARWLDSEALSIGDAGPSTIGSQGKP